MLAGPINKKMHFPLYTVYQYHNTSFTDNYLRNIYSNLVIVAFHKTVCLQIKF